MTTKNPTPLAEKLDATLAEIQTLTKTVEQLTEKVKGLEEMVKESNDILVAFPSLTTGHLSGRRKRNGLTKTTDWGGSKSMMTSKSSLEK